MARTNRRRPFMVITEAVMRGIAVARPGSEAELLQVKGIGPKKLERYGGELLRLVSDHSPTREPSSGRPGEPE